MSALKAVFDSGSDVREADIAISDLARQVSRPREEIEQYFSEMGKQLMTCTRLLNDVAAAHGNMPAELQSEEFSVAAQLLETVRERIPTLTSAHSEEESFLGQLAAVAEEVGQPLVELRKAVRSIRFIAVNAQSAAAGVRGRHLDIKAFTTDMMELGQSVESAITSFSDAHSRFVDSLQNARVAKDGFSELHGGTLARISCRLADHLSVVDTHQIRAAEKSLKHSQLTDQIRERVGKAVSALQIGDITRQRIEHVELALDMLAREYLPEDKPGDSYAYTHTSAVLCHLQVMQLEETIADFDREMLDLEHSLQQLSGDAAAVLQAGSEEAETLLSSSSNALAAIINELHEICTLLDEYGQSRSETQYRVEEASNEVIRSLQVMAGHLRAVTNIERQIRLLSFNTVIQCGHLGNEGLALKVIAQNLREIAGQTVSAADAIMIGLAGAEELTKNLSANNSNETTEQLSKLEQDAEKAQHLLETVVQRLHDHAADLSETGLKTVHQIEKVSAGTTNTRGLSENLLIAIMGLRSFAPLPMDLLDKAAIDTEMLSKLRFSYTMDGERRIYDALTGASTDDQSCQDGEPEEEFDVDDLLF